MDDQVLVIIPGCIGHVFVVCDREDWNAIYDIYEADAEIEIESEGGDLIPVNLYASVKNAIVVNMEPHHLEIVDTLDEYSVELFDAICYNHFSQQRVIDEPKFIENIMSLIKKLEGRIYDTRAIGLAKTRVTFYYKGMKHFAVMDATTSPPSYFICLSGEVDWTVCSQNYIADMEKYLLSLPELEFEVDVEDVKTTIGDDDHDEDLADFDTAMGPCIGDTCEAK